MRMTDQELLSMLQDLDAALKMQSMASAPGYAFVGPSTVELASQKIELLLAENEALRKEAFDMELKITEAEVQKLNLQAGEILIVKIRSDEINDASMNALRSGFKALLPNNKVVVMGVGSEGSIDLTAVQPSEYPVEESCGPGPANYCNSCSCGKKEAFESKLKGE